MPNSTKTDSRTEKDALSVSSSTHCSSLLTTSRISKLTFICWNFWNSPSWNIYFDERRRKDTDQLERIGAEAAHECWKRGQKACPNVQPRRINPATLRRSWNWSQLWTRSCWESTDGNWDCGVLREGWGWGARIGRLGPHEPAQWC